MGNNECHIQNVRNLCRPGFRNYQKIPELIALLIITVVKFCMPLVGLVGHTVSDGMVPNDNGF